MSRKRPRRLMLFTVAFEEGGGERLYVNLLRHLDRSEFEPKLVCWRIHESHFVDELPADVEVFDLRRAGRFRSELPRLLWKTTQLIRRLRPEVILAISTEANAFLFAARAAAGSRAPVVLDEQGSASDWLRHIRDRQPRRAWLTGVGYKRLYLPAADRVVCAAETVRRDLIDNFGGEPTKLVTIPNPLDLERVTAAAGEEADHPWLDDGLPLIVSAGRFFPQKGYDVLARAFVRVAATTSARMLLVGDGPERARISDILVRGGVADRVAFVGYQENPFRYVGRGTVFALPSHAEGFGYVLAEALALGIPAVSTDCAGALEILDGGRFGEIVPRGDSEAMAAAIAHLLADPERRDELSVAGRRRANDFGIPAVLGAYSDVLAACAP